jgi:hypothetical protein
MNSGFSDLQLTNSDSTSLKLSDVPQDPRPNTCLAHLKLLFTFQSLKEDVGWSDGLWDIWDANYPSTPDAAIKALATVREKRWALFVARAVDRYEAWWSTLSGQMLTERDMEKDRTRYLNFMANWEPMNWSLENMPPLGMMHPSRFSCLSVLTRDKDVLLVLHAHMLNPRLFLEVSISTWSGRICWLADN